MYTLTRLLLIAAVLLAAYCAVVLTILFPWVGIIVAVGLGVAAARRGKALWAHGTARWAQTSDLEGMLGGKGLIIGRLNERR
jgi:hypothetical protein